jgi:hypothetical protein
MITVTLIHGILPSSSLFIYYWRRLSHLLNCTHSLPRYAAPLWCELLRGSLTYRQAIRCEVRQLRYSATLWYTLSTVSKEDTIISKGSRRLTTVAAAHSILNDLLSTSVLNTGISSDSLHFHYGLGLSGLDDNVNGTVLRYMRCFACEPRLKVPITS